MPEFESRQVPRTCKVKDGGKRGIIFIAVHVRSFGVIVTVIAIVIATVVVIIIAFIFTTVIVILMFLLLQLILVLLRTVNMKSDAVMIGIRKLRAAETLVLSTNRREVLQLIVPKPVSNRKYPQTLRCP